jgi:hypothetical protein
MIGGYDGLREAPTPRSHLIYIFGLSNIMSRFP